jgi:hypothetical protein
MWASLSLGLVVYFSQLFHSLDLLSWLSPAQNYHSTGRQVPFHDQKCGFLKEKLNYSVKNLFSCFASLV